MVANIRGYTPNYGFKLINFDTPRWHTLEYANWTLIDQLLSNAGISTIRGYWENNTHYIEGERVVDRDIGEIFRANTTHTSPPTGNFSDYRAAHPGDWELMVGGVPIFVGDWAPNTAYSIGDIVVRNTYDYYLCVVQHTSTATFDPVKFQTVFLASNVVADTNEARDDAIAASVDANTSKVAAATSAAAALASENAAEASEIEATNQVAKLSGTSNTNLAVPFPGAEITLTTQAGKHFYPGTFVLVVSDTVNTHKFTGTVISYSGTTLVVRVDNSFGGSFGPYNNWHIYVSGAVGPQGIVDEAPSDGEQYVRSNGSWNALIDIASPISIGTSPPTGVPINSLWWDSDSGKLLILYNDGDTTQWVEAVSVPDIDHAAVVLKSGDTMLGHLALPTGPNAQHAVRKDYVDNAISTAGNTANAADLLRVLKAGDTMSGPLIVTPKGSAFGSAGGSNGFGSVNPSDANVLLYNFNGGNWSGIGADGNGNMWFRSGLGGSPAPAFVINASSLDVDFRNHILTDKNIHLGRSGVGNATLSFGAAAANLTWDGGSFHLSGASYFFINANVQANGALRTAIGGGNTGTLYFGTGDNYIHFNGSTFAARSGAFYVTSLHSDNDIWSHPTATTGYYHFGTSGTKYLSYDGTNFSFNGAPLVVHSNFVVNGTAYFNGRDEHPYGWKASVGGYIQQGGGGPVEIVAPNGQHSFITFHVSAAFACNFGLDSTGNFYMGGWSHGGAIYKFWTTRDFTALPNSGIQTIRLAYVGDYWHINGVGLAEPYGGSVHTGWQSDTYSGPAGYGDLARYRQMQVSFDNVNWYAVGFA